MPFLSGYTKRKKIIVDHTFIDATLTDFPLLVKIAGDTDIGGDIDVGGLNIRFTSSDGTTLLKYERQSFSVSGGSATGVFWVKVPSLDGAANTDIYVYYKGGTAVEGADPTNVWDSNFLAVWHLEQDPSGSAPQMQDSTASNLDGTSEGAMTTSDLVAGAVGDGLDFDGSNDGVDFTNISSTFASGDLTVETWVNPTNFSVSRSIFDKRSGATAGFGTFGGITSGPFNSRWDATDIAAGTVTTGAMNYLVVTRSGTSVRHYKAGVDVGGGTTANDGSSTNSVKIGRRSFSSPGSQWLGVIDEVRVSIIARSAEWIKFTNHNIAEADNEISFGAQEFDSTSISASDVVALADTVSVAIRFIKSATDAVAVTDAVSAVIPVIKSGADSVTSVDAATKQIEEYQCLPPNGSYDASGWVVMGGNPGTLHEQVDEVDPNDTDSIGYDIGTNPFIGFDFPTPTVIPPVGRRGVTARIRWHNTVINELVDLEAHLYIGATLKSTVQVYNGNSFSAFTTMVAQFPSSALDGISDADFANLRMRYEWSASSEVEYYMSWTQACLVLVTIRKNVLDGITGTESARLRLRAVDTVATTEAVLTRLRKVGLEIVHVDDVISSPLRRSVGVDAVAISDLVSMAGVAHWFTTDSVLTTETFERKVFETRQASDTVSVADVVAKHLVELILDCRPTIRNPRVATASLVNSRVRRLLSNPLATTSLLNERIRKDLKTKRARSTLLRC